MIASRHFVENFAATAMGSSQLIRFVFCRFYSATASTSDSFRVIKIICLAKQSFLVYLFLNLPLMSFYRFVL